MLQRKYENPVVPCWKLANNSINDHIGYSFLNICISKLFIYYIYIQIWRGTYPTKLKKFVLLLLKVIRTFAHSKCMTRTPLLSTNIDFKDSYAYTILVGIFAHKFDKSRWYFRLFDIKTWHVHYNDVIMSAIASQITSLTFFCSSVYSGTDQRKHQSSASLAFVTGEFPAQRANNAENVSVWWRHHDIPMVLAADTFCLINTKLNVRKSEWNMMWQLFGPPMNVRVFRSPVIVSLLYHYRRLRCICTTYHSSFIPIVWINQLCLYSRAHNLWQILPMPLFVS